MELLAVTLVRSAQGKDADLLAQVRLIAETIRSVSGLITSGFYRGGENAAYYVILTTWEDEESWQRARERHNPKQLLLTNADLLATPPEQWLVHYLWGYSRPSSPPLLAALHLIAPRADQLELTRRAFIEGVRRPSLQPTLAFAFLAQGMYEDVLTRSAPPIPIPSEPQIVPSYPGPILLGLFCWTHESDRDSFYADSDYKAINKLVNSIGVSRALSLEPM